MALAFRLWNGMGEGCVEGVRVRPWKHMQQSERGEGK